MLQFVRGDDGGLVVDMRMRTSVADVFAAGDVATVRRHGVDAADGENWFQVALICTFDSTHDARCISGLKLGRFPFQIHFSSPLADGRGGCARDGQPPRRPRRRLRAGSFRPRDAPPRV